MDANDGQSTIAYQLVIRRHRNADAHTVHLRHSFDQTLVAFPVVTTTTVKITRMPPDEGAQEQQFTP